MSVYKPAKSPYFQYDFRLKGRRFHGSTGVETRRAAEQVERNVRQKAALGQLDDASMMTLDEAAGRWWEEKGKTLKGGERLESRMERAINLIGPALPIGEITTPVMSRAIEKRRGQTRTHAKGPKAKKYLPSASTVNRDMIDAVRPILNRARKVWGAKLPEIDWQALRMAEPKPVPKEFARAELESVKAHVMPHWHDFIHIANRYGCRLSEMFFALDDLDLHDLDDARVRLRERKGGKDHVIPLLPEDAAMLAARTGRARAAGLDTVWFRERRLRGPGGKTVLKALKYGGAEIAMRRAMERSGLKAAKGIRGAHGFRHNTAMKTLRESKNLRLVQELLGHADIKSTMVYAHAVESDVRAALAAVSRNSPEPSDAGQPEDVADQPAKGSGAGGS